MLQKDFISCWFQGLSVPCCEKSLFERRKKKEALTDKDWNLRGGGSIEFSSPFPLLQGYLCQCLNNGGKTVYRPGTCALWPETLCVAGKASPTFDQRWSHSQGLFWRRPLCRRQVECCCCWGWKKNIFEETFIYRLLPPWILNSLYTNIGNNSTQSQLNPIFVVLEWPCTVIAKTFL